MTAIRKTPEEFGRIVKEYADRLASDAAFADIMAVLCGSPDVAARFAEARGVSMGSFAGMVNLPDSTVRHYQRLGLITPYEVNGKFRFWVHNLAQAESVRQWQSLGLSLEEILEQRDQERVGGQAALLNWKNATKSASVLIASGGAFPSGAHRLGDWEVYVERTRPARPFLAGTTKNSGVFVTPENVSAREGEDLGDWRRAMQRAQSEVHAARKRLEEKLAALQEQLQRAQELEAALERHSRRG
ncbi:MerR family transcriptional regulator [Deinococcus yavapaiensis]|uniref:MerR-like DNA binding protein n=1 Tax=Deinococcus yavapaiensis KR-236 TaxID=694435 RepID=A0A318SE55_9DEIO|nr:MerR family transcriptional regulator [Deinococcus yavapaiensis]PYE55351.1 MerR-like DNA binding protein [Deinococcus yavapaiensis KR-236]